MCNEVWLLGAGTNMDVHIRVDRLSEVVGVCEAIHNRSRGSTIANSRMFHSRSFFEKGLLHGKAICALIAPIQRKEDGDLAGICALARSLIETHNALLYISEFKIGASELEFRIALMHLNQATDLLRINDALGIPESDMRCWAQRMSRNFAVDELEENSVFSSLDEKQRKHLLLGRVPFLGKRYRGPRPIKQQIEAAVYNLLSHNVHSYGLSSRFGGQITPAGSVNTLFLAVEMALIFLAHMARHYQRLRSPATGKLRPDDRAMLDEVLSLAHFQSWVRERHGTREWVPPTDTQR